MDSHVGHGGVVGVGRSVVNRASSFDSCIGGVTFGDGAEPGGCCHQWCLCGPGDAVGIAPPSGPLGSAKEPFAGLAVCSGRRGSDLGLAVRRGEEVLGRFVGGDTLVVREVVDFAAKEDAWWG